MALVKLIFHYISFVIVVTTPLLASVIHDKIIEQAPGSEFLFAASIASPSTVGHACTGIILNKRWIISSALCVTQNSDKQELKIYYGSHNRTHDQRKIAEIEKIVLHPEFEQRKLRNNLALMKIKTNIDFIPTVVDAAILPTRETLENDAVALIGWEQIDAEVSERILFFEILWNSELPFISQRDPKMPGIFHSIPFALFNYSINQIRPKC